MKYHKREITYDEKTENFKITCPELGLEVLGDTEMGALLEMRKEVVAAAKRPKTQTMPSLNVRISEMTKEEFGRAYNEPFRNHLGPPVFTAPNLTRDPRHHSINQSSHRPARRISPHRGCPRCLYPGARPPGCSQCGELM